MAPVLALGEQGQHSGRGGLRRGWRSDAVTEPSPRPRRRGKYLLIAVGATLLCLLVGLWYTTTNSFQAYVRRRMIAEVERITGGDAAICPFPGVAFHPQV